MAAAQVNAAVGCIARMPLPTLHSIKVDDPVPMPSGPPPERRLDRRQSFTSRLHSAWAPYLRETALRMFASAGISAQVGAPDWLFP